MKPENLEGLETDLRSYYGTMSVEMERSRKLYHHDVKNLVKVPAGMTVHESSTANLIVDNLRDQIRTDEPRVEFETVGKSQVALQEKTLMETWGESVLWELTRRNTIDPLQQLVHDMLMLGACCLKFIVDPQTLATPEASPLPPEARRQAFPFIVKPLDPAVVYPAPGSRRPLNYVLEVQQRRAIDIRSQYGDSWHDPLLTKRGVDKPMRPVTWLEYWSAPIYRNGEKKEDGYYIVEADGIRIIETKNPYGIVPYLWEFSGLGRSNHDGDPAHLAVSVLSSIVGELEEEIRIKTAQAHQWLFHAYPRLLTTDDPRKVRRQLMVGAGSIIKYDPSRGKPEWLETPAPNPAMLQFLQELMGNIYKKASPVLTERPEGVDAGVHQAILLGQALKMLSPVLRTLNSMGTDLLNGMAHQMSHLGLSMNVRGKQDEQERMVSGGKFKHYNFRIEFESVDPVENDRRMLSGLALRRDRADGLPLISRHTFMDKYMKGIVEDPDEEDVMVISEAVLAQLVASGALSQAAMAAIQPEGQDAVAGAVEEARGQVRGGAGMGGGQPGVLGRAAEGASGTQIPRRGGLAGPGESSALGGL
tara:strand:+ start:623 stop:2386 length:1764 start_codon:yes stop_codon:yes gene_type:complete